MFITLTQRFIDYLKDDGEWVFTPQVFVLSDYRGAFGWELTDEGAELAEQYLDDSSWGYDLRDGRAKGLAQEYTDSEMFYKLVTSPEYVKEPESEDFNVWELVELILS